MMTIKQQVLKAVYPIFSKLNSVFGNNNKQINSSALAPESFYGLTATKNNGEKFSFSNLEGKKIMLVNTASDCGYTAQYDGLQALYEKYKGKIEIIGFPSNDFGEQEKEGDEVIANFCKINFGVGFPLMQKSVVKKNANQHPVYQWLTDETKNGWNYVAPTWNFCKYIIDQKGNLTNFFEASTEPMSKEILSALELG
ncbi:MAG: glutathione peroxidase [Ferruginibacter sp.]